MRSSLAKRGLLLVVVVALVLLGVMLTNTLRLESAAREEGELPALDIDIRRVCKRLARAIQIPSVATEEPSALELGRMQRMVDFVVETYPPLQDQLTFERHSHALVFRWEGTRPELAPLLLLAHLDVVPVDLETAQDWTHPPFSGEIAAGYVWGRGALDDKSSALAMLEAIEHLLSRGFRPRRGVVVALGLDEEIGGARGAARLAADFAREGLSPYLILDEGFAVLEGIVDAVPGPVAGVGIAEKGAVTVELRVALEGGHSSMPARQTSLGVLAAAISALENEPFPARLDGAAGEFFDELARDMEFGPKFLFCNRWITEPLLRRILDGEPSTAALLRTTTAVTTARGGVAQNVLPEVARATVNFRIHSRDSVSSVLEHVVRVIGDPRVEIKSLGQGSEPSALSPVTGEAWSLLESTIRECYPGVQVAPALVLGQTDSRHYAGLSPNVYRFNGLRFGPGDLARVHGSDERISTKNYVEMIRFYLRLIERA